MYKVEMLIFGGWDDAPWSEDGHPCNTFPSREAAQLEIDDLIQETEFAVRAQHMESALSHSDFRVVPVTEKEKA